LREAVLRLQGDGARLTMLGDMRYSG
jgi:hypothetical protein